MCPLISCIICSSNSFECSNISVLYRYPSNFDAQLPICKQWLGCWVVCASWLSSSWTSIWSLGSHPQERGRSGWLCVGGGSCPWCPHGPRLFMEFCYPGRHSGRREWLVSFLEESPCPDPTPFSPPSSGGTCCCGAVEAGRRVSWPPERSEPLLPAVGADCWAFCCMGRLLCVSAAMI